MKTQSIIHLPSGFSYLCSSVLLLAIFACKPAPDSPTSQVASLDNFAAGDNDALNLNSCGTKDQTNSYVKAQYNFPENKLAAIENWLKSFDNLNDESLKNTVRDVLKVIPFSMGKMFFADSQGKVILSTEAYPQICMKLKNEPSATYSKDQSEKQPSACWSVENGKPVIAIGKGNKASMELAIRHSLLRAQALYYAFVIFNAKTKEFFKANAMPDKAPVLEREYNLREILIQALERDMAGEKSSTKLSALKGRADFKDALYAEIVDSYFCSGKSQKILKACFPNSYSAFEHGKLEQLPVDKKACSAAKNT